MCDANGVNYINLHYLCRTPLCVEYSGGNKVSYDKQIKDFEKETKGPAIFWTIAIGILLVCFLIWSFFLIVPQIQAFLQAH